MTLKEYIETNLPWVKTLNKDSEIDYLDPNITIEFSKNLWDLAEDDILELANDNWWFDIYGKYDSNSGLSIYQDILSDTFDRDCYFLDMAKWTIEQLFIDDAQE